MSRFWLLKPQSKHLCLTANGRAVATGTQRWVKVYIYRGITHLCVFALACWYVCTAVMLQSKQAVLTFISLNSFYLKLHSTDLQISSSGCHCYLNQFLQVVLMFF